MGEFHSRDGLFFERHPNAGVRVRIASYETGHEETIKEVFLEPNEWASVVASMSAAGESFDTWDKAMKAQTDPIYMVETDR